MNETRATIDRDQPTTGDYHVKLGGFNGQVRSDTTVTTAVLLLTRGFERIYAATSEERVWLTTQIRQPPARENKVDATSGVTTR